MSELIEFDEVLDDEELDMGSLYHGTTQANLTTLLHNDEKFAVVVIELSLDASQIDLKRFGLKAKDELVPDVCVYTSLPPTPDDEIEDDILRVSQMPDLAIEVLSPSQSVSFLVRKIKAYFAMGIKSCWLVMPSVEVINIYSQAGKKTFDMNDIEIVDDVIDIRLPIQKVFQNVFKKRSLQKNNQ